MFPGNRNSLTVSRQQKFIDQGKMKGSFLRYFEYLMKERKDSQGNYGNWDIVQTHEEILQDWCFFYAIW